MAIRFSVFVLASLPIVAHALTGLRKRGASQADNAFQALPAPDNLGCPSTRFPTLERCRILMGPCLTRLNKCDEYYAASGLGTYTESIRRRRTDRNAVTPSIPDTQKCEMATCLAQVSYHEDAVVGPAGDGVVVGPGTLPNRTANDANQPDHPEEDSEKGEDQVATLCTKEFMKSHKTNVDVALMKCVQLRARRVTKRPYHERITTTPAPSPANWFCIPRINFHTEFGPVLAPEYADTEVIKKDVLGPFATIEAAKAILAEPMTRQDASGKKRRLEQFVCEIRVKNKYQNTLQPGHPGAKFPLQQGEVAQTPWLLGAVATPDSTYNQYTQYPANSPQAKWGADTAQTSPNFNIGCYSQASSTLNRPVETCPDREVMLDMCQHDKKCNPSNPALLRFHVPAPAPPAAT